MVEAIEFGKSVIYFINIMAILIYALAIWIHVDLYTSKEPNDVFTIGNYRVHYRKCVVVTAMILTSLVLWLIITTTGALQSMSAMQTQIINNGGV